MMYAKKQELIEKDNFFMDDEKKMKMYGTLIPQVSVEKNELSENTLENDDFDIENISEESLSDEERKQINEIFNFNSKIDLNTEKLELISRQWKDRYENHVLYNREFEKASAQMKADEKSLKNYFSQIGVPEEFVYLSIPESYARSKAKSHKGAVGFYQFMKGTGKQYGLRIDNKVDERTNLLKSGQACGKFLKDLYEELGDWDLALYAYNGGFVRKYAKETKMHGEKPSKEGFLKYMEKMIQSVQQEVKSQSFVEYTVRKGDSIYSIAKKHSADLDRLKSLNKISSPQKIKMGQKIKIPLTQKNREEIFQKRISGFVENITYVEKCNAACQKASQKKA